jgi:CRISPR/Cas system-associated exonuclease Cas4 (RecB family)
VKLNNTPLELYVNDLIDKSILDREERPRTSIRVTDLSGPCMRKVWYDIKGIPFEFDLKTICNFEMGNMVHNRIVLNKKQNEIAIKANVRTNELLKQKEEIGHDRFYDCVSGKFDDVISFHGESILVDKKTYSSKWPIAVPKEPSSDYIFQLNVYKLLFWIKTGTEIKRAVIAYIDVATKMQDKISFEIELKPIEEIKASVIEKLNTLSKKTEPDRVVSKRCLYCPFLKTCKPESTENYTELTKVWK